MHRVGEVERADRYRVQQTRFHNEARTPYYAMPPSSRFELMHHIAQQTRPDRRATNDRMSANDRPSAIVNSATGFTTISANASAGAYVLYGWPAPLPQTSAQCTANADAGDAAANTQALFVERFDWTSILIEFSRLMKKPLPVFKPLDPAVAVQNNPENQTHNSPESTTKETISEKDTPSSKIPAQLFPKTFVIQVLFYRYFVVGLSCGRFP